MKKEECKDILGHSPEVCDEVAISRSTSTNNSEICVGVITAIKETPKQVTVSIQINKPVNINTNKPWTTNIIFNPYSAKCLILNKCTN